MGKLILKKLSLRLEDLGQSPVHSIHWTPKVSAMATKMRADANGVIDLQCELPGTPKEKLPKVSAPCLSESRIKGS